MRRFAFGLVVAILSTVGAQAGAAPLVHERRCSNGACGTLDESVVATAEAATTDATYRVRLAVADLDGDGVEDATLSVTASVPGTPDKECSVSLKPTEYSVDAGNGTASVDHAGQCPAAATWTGDPTTTEPITGTNEYTVTPTNGQAALKVKEKGNRTKCTSNLRLNGQSFTAKNAVMDHVVSIAIDEPGVH